MSFFSCKDNANKKTDTQLFRKSPATRISEDSVHLQPELNIESSIGIDTERGSWQNPDLVIKKLGDLSGKIVADIGSGTGYFTLPISRVAQKVVAIDIEQRFLDYIEDRKLELPIEQADVIETRLTVEKEPNLHTDEVDAVLMVNTFYYLYNRSDYMRIVNDALRNNGILVLVDFMPGNLPVGPSTDKVSSKDVIEILKIAGFKDIQVDEESLQYQFIITAK